MVSHLEQRNRALEQSNRKLRESERRFRATFEQAPVGIARVGLDGRFMDVNDKLCEFLGYPRDELLLMNAVEMSAPEDRAAGDDARRAMGSGQLATYASEKRYRRKDGSLVWASLASTAWRDGAEQPDYFISVITDISERKALEAQLRQTQKLESIGQLTGGLAHDFNNLLTVIIGNAELLAERLEGDETLRACAEMTRMAASRGAELTQRLLAFARRQALAPQAVDVNELLLGMERMLRRMLPEDIEIALARCHPLAPALVDPAQLEAAVLNLCINARDAMNGGGHLTLETRNVRIDDELALRQAELSPGAYVMLAVSDTGTGIAPEHLARVFEPFFTTKPAGKGTGLGLSMVYGFIKQSRGHVKIYSEPGQGTSVKLYLPVASRSDEGVGAETLPGALDLTGCECILLVEDDELVRRYAEQQLTSLGYVVLTAENGAKAMALVRSRSDIDLLLTDVVMPGGMNGQQLADEAQALRPGLRVLFCSGYADNALVHHGRMTRGMHLLSKPYGRRELARKVRMALADPAQHDVDVRTQATRLLILDDDRLVGGILVMAARKLGVEAELTSDASALLNRLAEWQPSHVAIDLSMPNMDGLQVLDRLAEAGCGARIIISSGADSLRLRTALDHARARGLRVAGALPKPFSSDTLRSLLT
jgi:PAS domain S-box-containing protein